jgi:hypothetical protein
MATTTAPGSGRTEMALRPKVVRSSDLFLRTRSTVRFALPANRRRALFGFDELLDRRQLINQEVRVIRYKQMSTQARGAR